MKSSCAIQQLWNLSFFTIYLKYLFRQCSGISYCYLGPFSCSFLTDTWRLAQNSSRLQCVLTIPLFYFLILRTRSRSYGYYLYYIQMYKHAIGIYCMQCIWIQLLPASMFCFQLMWWGGSRMRCHNTRAREMHDRNNELPRRCLPTNLRIRNIRGVTYLSNLFVFFF